MSQQKLNIFSVLKNNKYPKRVLQGMRKLFGLNQRKLAEAEKDSVRVTLPYVKGIPEALRWILARANIETTFHPCSTPGQQLVKLKDPTSPKRKANVVYSIPCKGFSAVYVGQTGRQLSTQLRAVKVSGFNTSVTQVY